MNGYDSMMMKTPILDKDMKIRYSKDYSFLQSMYKSDIQMLRRGREITMPSDYDGTWEEADVTMEELQEYVKQGYAIKINC